jgi:hypothetical protein
MVIEKGEPWILWPDKVSYGINRGNIAETFEGTCDFTLGINLKIISTEGKRTIFAKLPNYCGIDLEGNNNPLLILKILKGGQEKYEYIRSQIEVNYDYNFFIYRYKKSEGLIEVLVNEEIAISYKLGTDEQLTSEEEPHIIFGAGNFPENDFNMNLCSYDVDFLVISKSHLSYEEIKEIKEKRDVSKEIVGMYDFKKKTEYKIYDLSKNCNFIHKII